MQIEKVDVTMNLFWQDKMQISDTGLFYLKEKYTSTNSSYILSIRIILSYVSSVGSLVSKSLNFKPRLR